MEKRASTVVGSVIPCAGACKSDEMMTLGWPTQQSNMRHSRSDGDEGKENEITSQEREGPCTDKATDHMGELKRERKKALFASPRSVICAHSYSATLVYVKKKKIIKKKRERGRERVGAIRAPHLIQLVGAFNRHTT